MRKALFLLSLIGVSQFTYANNESNREDCIPEPCIHSSYAYGGIGLGPLPFPALTLSVGKRIALHDSCSIDGGLTLATLVRWNLIRGYVNGLFYLNQKPCSQFYVGLGGSVGVPFGYDEIYKAGALAAPSLLVGKEFYNSEGNKRFFQAEVLYPVYGFSEDEWFNLFPVITLKYGFAF